MDSGYFYRFCTCNTILSSVGSNVVAYLIMVAFEILQAFAELKDLADEIALVELVSPTLIIIGKVVALSPFWPHNLKHASCLVEVK